MDPTLANARIKVPGLEKWLDHVFTVMGGFMAGGGVLTMFVASIDTTAHAKAAEWTIALAGILTVSLMSATNFALDSDFKELLAVPALAWLVCAALHVTKR